MTFYWIRESRAHPIGGASFARRRTPALTDMRLCDATRWHVHDNKLHTNGMAGYAGGGSDMLFERNIIGATTTLVWMPSGRAAARSPSRCARGEFDESQVFIRRSRQERGVPITKSDDQDGRMRRAARRPGGTLADPLCDASRAAYHAS